MLVFFTNLSLVEFQVRYLALFLLFSAIGSFRWLWMGNLHKNIQLIEFHINESDLRDTVDWGMKWFVDFNAGKPQLVLFDQSKNTGAIDVKIDGLTFHSKLDWGSSYLVSIAKTASKKIVALIHSMKFLSPEVALYLYKSTIRPYMEYCCHVWAGAPSCYLELLDKLQKRICKTVGPSLPSLLSLHNPWFIVEM